MPKKKKQDQIEIEDDIDNNSENKIMSPKTTYSIGPSLPFDFAGSGISNIPIANYTDTIINDDCLNVLKNLPENSIDLIITSPPYADQRSSTYGGINPDHYVQWFQPRADEFLRVLKPKGSFILNMSCLKKVQIKNCHITERPRNSRLPGQKKR